VSRQWSIDLGFGTAFPYTSFPFAFLSLHQSLARAIGQTATALIEAGGSHC